MGDRTTGGRGVQGIVYIPGGRGRPAETVGVITPRAGESLSDAASRQGISTRGARVYTYQPTRGGRLGADTDINDLGLSARQLQRGSTAGNAAGLREAAGDFVQSGRRSVAARRSAQAAGRESSVAEFNRTRNRILRQTRGQSDRRRQAALRAAGLPSRALRAPLTVADVNRGRIVG